MTASQRPPSLHAVARYYANVGLAVFPLRPRTKIPQTEHGCLDATTRLETIDGWWKRWPDANVGVACGEPSAVWVLDVDGADGETKLAELELAHGALPGTLEARTKRGRHLYFAFDARVRNSAKRLPMLDTRSTGGYVVAPPSVHPDGDVYAWTEGRGPKSIAPATAPEWLVELFLAKKPSPQKADAERPAPPPVPSASDSPERRWCLAALDKESHELSRVPEGSRGSAANKSAFKLAGYCHSGGLHPNEIESALFDACVGNGLVEKDGVASVRAVLRRGLDAGIDQPRPLPTDLGARARRAHDPAPPRDEAPPHDDAPPPPPPPDDDGFDGEPPSDDPAELPEIFDTTDEYLMAELADQYIGPDPDLYQRGGMLVQVLLDKSPGAGVTRDHSDAVIRAVETAWLRALSTRRVRWMKKRVVKGEWEEYRTKPPSHAIAAFHAKGEWNHVRKLEAIATAPIFRADGTICSTPGYDPKSGVLFAPTEEFPGIPEHPSRQDIDDAVEALRHPVHDFPFEKPHHEAGWFAAVLTPIARHAFRGPAPLFLVDANTPGTGKGKLATLIGLIATGRPPATKVYSHDENEQKKLITGITLAGEQLVLFDNVEGRFGSAALCIALTSDQWSDRVLGGNELFTGPLLTTWIATANNVSLTTDMVRRVAHIRLSTPLERPEERTGFEIPELEAYVRQHRARLNAAALTILRGWHVAGRPRADLPTWGSYEGWSAVVRQALVHAGLADPGLARTELRAVADTGTEELTELMDALIAVQVQGAKYTSGELLTKARETDSGRPLKDALEAGTRGRSLNSKTVGKLLGRYRDRVNDGRVIRGHQDPARGQLVWWVERDKTGGAPLGRTASAAKAEEDHGGF